MDWLRLDLRYALRVLKQSRGFAMTAIAALALGIGANTAVFSVVNAVLLKPLPYPDAGRLVQFEAAYGGAATPTAGPKEFNFWRQQTSSFQEVSAHWLDHVNLTGTSPELIADALVSGNFFRQYGARTIRGRTFSGDEDRPNGGHVAVLGYEFWKRRFDAQAQVLGKSVVLGGVPYDVVGVLGPFTTEMFEQRPDIWLPFQIDPNRQDGEGRLCYVTGRLRSGTPLQQAQAELRLAAERYQHLFPGAAANLGFTVEPLDTALVGNAGPYLGVLAGAVALVLLIACANVANLLLARAAGRRREIAIRAALGASRRRIMQQLLAESLLLSGVGGALGLGLGWAGIRGLLSLYPQTPLGPASVNPVSIPRMGPAGSAVALDWSVLAFTFALSVLTGIAFGLLPARRLSRPDLHSALRAGGGHGSSFAGMRTLSALTAGEIILAILLLVGGGLLIRTSLALRAINPGFDARHVLTLQMSLAETDFAPGSGADRIVRDGIRAIGAVPGVENAAASCCLPLETVWQLPYIVAGRPLNGRFHGFAGWNFVSPQYFSALRIPLMRGRTFTEQDDSSAPGVAIINETMARRVWPGYPRGRNPLEERLLLGRTLAPAYDQDPVRQIVGIVGDVRDAGLWRQPRPIVYVPIAQVPDGVKALELPLLPMAWIVRTRGDSQDLGPAISEQLRFAAGDLPVARVRPMNQVTTASIALTRFQTVLMTAFGAVALLLAAIGIYGLMAYYVRQRRREMGIRLALGARPSLVQRRLLWHGLRLVLIGVAIAVPLALGLTRFLAGFLFGVTAHDSIVFATVPVVLSVVALTAVWFPARRAARTDPVEALRYE